MHLVNMLLWDRGRRQGMVSGTREGALGAVRACVPGPCPYGRPDPHRCPGPHCRPTEYMAAARARLHGRCAGCCRGEGGWRGVRLQGRRGRERAGAAGREWRWRGRRGMGVGEKESRASGLGLGFFYIVAGSEGERELSDWVRVRIFLYSRWAEMDLLLAGWACFTEAVDLLHCPPRLIN